MIFIIILLKNLNFHDFEKSKKVKGFEKLRMIQDSFLIQRVATLKLQLINYLVITSG